jgi:hypothetical protein
MLPYVDGTDNKVQKPPVDSFSKAQRKLPEDGPNEDRNMSEQIK